MERPRLEFRGHCPVCRAGVDFPEYRRERKEDDSGRVYAYCPSCGVGLRSAPAHRWVSILWPLMFLAQIFFIDLASWPSAASSSWVGVWLVLIAAAFLLPRYVPAAHPPRERMETCPLGEPVSAKTWAGIVAVSVVAGVLMVMAMGH